MSREDAGGRALTWSVLVDAPHPGAVNMARDRALAGWVEEGRAVLRLYGWTRPTISFGRNEPARDLYDRDAIARAGFDVVRRPTGGRSVLHADEVTYAVAWPSRALGRPRDAYLRIHGALRRGLASLGVEAEIAPRSADRSPGPDAGPCFALPTGGEVVVRSRKIVGSAQRRFGGTLLQHGSILLSDGQARLDPLRRAPGRRAGDAASSGSGSVALDELIERPTRAAVVDAVVGGFEAELGGTGERLDDALLEGEERWTRAFASARWIWRR